MEIGNKYNVLRISKVKTSITSVDSRRNSSSGAVEQLPFLWVMLSLNSRLAKRVSLPLQRILNPLYLVYLFYVDQTMKYMIYYV